MCPPTRAICDKYQFALQSVELLSWEIGTLLYSHSTFEVLLFACPGLLVSLIACLYKSVQDVDFSQNQGTKMLLSREKGADLEV